MDIGLDTDETLSKVTTEITAEDNAARLHDRLSELGATVLMDTLQALQNHSLTPEKQGEAQVTYVQKLIKAETGIKWGEPDYFYKKSWIVWM